MEVLSEHAILQERPETQKEDSADLKEQNMKPMATKKKIIRKKNKSKAIQEEKIEHSTIAETNTPNTMAPFGIFESETQKCQRLEHYFRRDIENFYKTQVQPYDFQILDNLLNYNLIQLTDVYNKDLSEVWKQKICSLPQIRNYLQIVNLIKKSNNNFSIIVDQISKKYYLSLQNQNGDHSILQLSQLQAHLLQNREKFLQILKNSQQKFCLKPKLNSEVNEHHKMSQISSQIAFLFKELYDSTKMLQAYVTHIKQNIQMVTKTQPPLEPSIYPQSRYFTYLIKKLLLISLNDFNIDYYNFFKNNQLAQHNYGSNQASSMDQKQFEQFMRKKKNKKGRKGKYVLHTACLGCCSSYFQQYNPFSYCQQCFVRFHRSCYTGLPVRSDFVYLNSKQQKDVLCQSCYNKKITPNFKMRGNQCDYCGIKGLLSVPAGQSKRIHIFCMLLNGLWTVKNSKIEFKSKIQNKVPYSDSKKCVYCHSGSGYLNFCSFCQKYVHASCAYFNGWKIVAQYDESNENVNVDLKLYCCKGVPLSQNEKRRKFVTNYRRQAYSF